MFGVIIDLIPIGFLIPAAITDVREGRIPNAVVFPGIILGFILTWSPHVLITKVLWILTLFVVGSLNIMGLGDIKLWMMVCSFAGALKSIVVIGIASAILVLHVAFTKKEEFIPMCKLMWFQLCHMNDVKFAVYEQTKYPFAQYVLLSYCIVLLWGWVL